MIAIGVIPARYASTRFPAKVLADLGGKPLIWHVWEKAKQSTQLQDVLIACDHEDVFKAAMGFGAKTIITDPNHPSGSDRIAEAVKDIDCDLVVNIQGDEPFIDPQVIDDLVLVLKNDVKSPVATAIKEIHSNEDFLNPNIVKCVIDSKGHALYFSRAPIPFNRNERLPEGMKRYKHLGIYAYRKDFLMQYKDWTKSILEITEQLEQLRILEKGYTIQTVLTQYETIAIDTPADLEKAKEWLKRLS